MALHTITFVESVAVSGEGDRIPGERRTGAGTLGSDIASPFEGDSPLRGLVLRGLVSRARRYSPGRDRFPARRPGGRLSAEGAAVAFLHSLDDLIRSTTWTGPILQK